MRAERVFDVAWDIRAELQELGIVALVEKLKAALEELAEDASADNQEIVANLREEISSALAKSKIDALPPSQYIFITQMKLSTLFGSKLQERIEQALTGNQLTPSKAAESIGKILNQLKRLEKESANAIESLRYFEVGTDDLEPGEFDVMIMIPGRAIDDELGAFGQEAVRLNSLLGVFSEIATGSREPFKLRAIASTDPTLFLHSPYAVAALLATTIERIATFYGQMQGIIKTHREMKAQKVPDSVSDGMKAFVEDSIKTGLDHIAASIEKESMKKVEAGRKNELRLELRRALQGIASRLDDGYVFDVRGEDLEEEKVTEGETAQAIERPERAAFKAVNAARANILFFNASDGPILGLPRPDNDNVK